MDLKSIWGSVREMLAEATVHDPSSKDLLEFGNWTQTLLWEKKEGLVIGSKTHHMFTLLKSSQHDLEWITKEFDFTMALTYRREGGYSHNIYEATISMKPHSRGGDLEELPSDLQFPRTIGPFEIAFGPVLIGVFSSKHEQSSWISTSAQTADKTAVIGFCGPHSAGSSLSTTLPGVIERYLASTPTLTACFKIRERTASISMFLTMHVSQAVAAMTTHVAVPFIPKMAVEKEPVKFTYRGAVFYADLDRLASVSPVFAACFNGGKFIESELRQYDMSAFSRDAVEQFLFFCATGHMPKFVDVAVELIELGHQYEVHQLVVAGEIFLIFELLGCDHVGRLGELAAVATNLELPLLLAAFEVLLNERLHGWLSVWTTEQVEAWFGLIKSLPDFETRRFQAFSNVRLLELSEEFKLGWKQEVAGMEH